MREPTLELELSDVIQLPLNRSFVPRAMSKLKERLTPAFRPPNMIRLRTALQANTRLAAERRLADATLHDINMEEATVHDKTLFDVRTVDVQRSLSGGWRNYIDLSDWFEVLLQAFGVIKMAPQQAWFLPSLAGVALTVIVSVLVFTRKPDNVPMAPLKAQQIAQQNRVLQDLALNWATAEPSAERTRR